MMCNVWPSKKYATVAHKTVKPVDALALSKIAGSLLLQNFLCFHAWKIASTSGDIGKISFRYFASFEKEIYGDIRGQSVQK